LPKRFVRASRPAETEFPAWLEGEWAATGSFDGFVLPHKDRFDTRRLMSERSVPGFTKASLVWLADVGRSGVGYRLRFSRRRGDGAVIADSAFNLTSVLEAYLDAPGAVESVELDGPNRVTLNTREGSVRGGARIELYRNDSETELRESDGTFFDSETFRQVNLDYSTTAGVAAMGVYDYTLVYTYTPLWDGDGEAAAGGVPSRLRSSLSVFAYLQPNVAATFSAAPSPAQPGGPPIPKAALGGLLDASAQPAILYSTHSDLERVK
jgi:hypothetical protein